MPSACPRVLRSHTLTRRFGITSSSGQAAWTLFSRVIDRYWLANCWPSSSSMGDASRRVRSSATDGRAL